MASEAPWRDADKLRELYHGESLSTYEIGERLDCSYQTVHDWLQKHEIDTRDSPTQRSDSIRPDEDTLREKYESGDRLADIAEDYDVVVSTVWTWFQRYDIDTRPTAGDLSGEESYVWVPNEEMVNRSYDPLWRKRREEVIEMDGECCRCGMAREEHKEQIGRDITVHHLQKARKFDDPEEAHSYENLITVCLPCHQVIEQYPIDVRHLQRERTT